MLRKATITAATGAVCALALLPGGEAQAHSASKHKVTHKADRNHDGLPDRWERRHHLSLRFNQANRDQDKDGLSNREEFRGGFHPRRADSDANGVPDDQEAIGTIKRFNGGLLVVKLGGGTSLRATVNEQTDLFCDSAQGYASDDATNNSSYQQGFKDGYQDAFEDSSDPQDDTDQTTGDDSSDQREDRSVKHYGPHHGHGRGHQPGRPGHGWGHDKHDIGQTQYREGYEAGYRKAEQDLAAGNPPQTDFEQAQAEGYSGEACAQELKPGTEVQAADLRLDRKQGLIFESLDLLVSQEQVDAQTPDEDPVVTTSR